MLKTDSPANSQLEQDAQALYDALQDLIRVYQFRDRDRICCHDLSVTQCYALDAVVRRRGITVNELSAELYLDKSTASRVVDALERKGYLKRNSHPDDRRAVQLGVTRSGKSLLTRIRRDIVEHEKSLIAGFDPKTRRAMTKLIHQLARAAAERVDTSGGTCCTKEA